VDYPWSSVVVLPVVSTFDRVMSPNGAAYFEYQNWSPGLLTRVPGVSPITICLCGALAWFVSLLVWALFGWLSRNPSPGKERV
jgi:hypothetical protein